MSSLAVACTANGRSLLAAADTEAAAKRWGLARSLAILALEELAKAMVYRLVQIEFASFDVDNPPSQAFMIVDRHILFNHREKHQLITLMMIGRAFLRAQGFDTDDPPAGLTPEIIAQLETTAPEEVMRRFTTQFPEGGFGTALKVLGSNPKLLERLRKIALDLKSWESMKMAGFYVDESSKLTLVPSMIGPGEFGEVRGLVDIWLAVNERLLDYLPPEILPYLSKLAQSLSAKVTDKRKVLLCKQCRRKTRLLAAA
jgi:AbiV family abortive infection protein